LITNDGKELLSLASPGSTAALTFVVFDHFWNPVPPESLGKVHVAPEVLDIPPNHTHVWDFRDLVAASGTLGTVMRLPLGKYSILAVYHPGTAGLPEQSEYPVVAVSNVVTMTIVPRNAAGPA
jgi:hypothetical protein